MNPRSSFLRRDVAAVKPWTETCGQIRPLIEEKDLAAAEVHHLEITDAKLHYHERTDEIYYVLDGTGRMRLGDDEIELRKDVAVARDQPARGALHMREGPEAVVLQLEEPVRMIEGLRHPE